VTYPTGDTFVGEFNDAKQKHGFGKYTWSTEVGEGGPKNKWVPMTEEGDASALPAERVIAFEGLYKEGKKDGVGKMTYPNGDKYHGEWKEDKQDGEGTYYYANGDLYSGQWRAGVKHGRGAYVFKADDSQLVGQWEEGVLKVGKWIWHDGTSWHGSFKGNRPIGVGVFYFPNGNMQDGVWVEEGGGEEEEEEEGAERKLVWRGGAVVPGTADHRDLLAPPPADEESKE
jgi:hypothetical protein